MSIRHYEIKMPATSLPELVEGGSLFRIEKLYGDDHETLKQVQGDFF